MQGQETRLRPDVPATVLLIGALQALQRLASCPQLQVRTPAICMVTAQQLCAAGLCPSSEVIFACNRLQRDGLWQRWSNQQLPTATQLCFWPVHGAHSNLEPGVARGIVQNALQTTHGCSPTMPQGSS